jgi:hypothetical protein
MFQMPELGEKSDVLEEKAQEKLLIKSRKRFLK